MATDVAVDREEQTPLARRVGRRLLLLFIIGDVLGAGIYAVVGEVAAETGGAVWTAFAVAFGLAFLTAASYAELVTRYPKAAGAALYVNRAFRRPFLTFVVAFAVVMSGVTSASTSARAFAGDYLAEFVSAPVVPIALGFVVVVSIINWIGISESVKVNVVLTTIEVLGLLVVIVTGALALANGDAEVGRAMEFPADASVPLAIVGGTSLAFFSLIGFEDSVNIAEEVEHPRRDYPWALFTGLSIVFVVYVLVSVLAVAVVDVSRLQESSGPLLEVVDAGPLPISTRLFSLIALVAVSNTVLINLIMASRLTYGMSREGVIPRVFGRVDERRRTPWVAIIFVTIFPFVLIPTGDLGTLADTTVLLLLLVFALVNVSVLVIRRREGEPRDTYRAPTWMPVTGAVASLGLLTTQEGGIWLRALLLLGVGIVLWGIQWISGHRPQQIDAEHLADVE